MLIYIYFRSSLLIPITQHNFQHHNLRWYFRHNHPATSHRTPLFPTSYPMRCLMRYNYMLYIRLRTIYHLKDRIVLGICRPSQALILHLLSVNFLLVTRATFRKVFVRENSRFDKAFDIFLTFSYTK